MGVTEPVRVADGEPEIDTDGVLVGVDEGDEPADSVSDGDAEREGVILAVCDED